MSNASAQAKSAVTILLVLSETIREVKEIPSGTLYAHVLDKLPLDQYQKALNILKGAGLVEETPAHLLRWIGPAIGEAKTTT